MLLICQQSVCEYEVERTKVTPIPCLEWNPPEGPEANRAMGARSGT